MPNYCNLPVRKMRTTLDIFQQQLELAFPANKGLHFYQAFPGSKFSIFWLKFI